MPRPLRVHIEGALYYVTSRAAEGQPLFRNDQDYATYLELIRQAREQGGGQMKVYGFLLLPGQLQLCLEPTGTQTVSAFMQAVNSRYTKYVAKQHGPTSHVFQERFKSTLLEKAPNLLRVTGYLHAYPGKSGMAIDLRAYRWSSYAAYLAAATAINGLSLAAETAEVLEHLSRACPGAGYDRYVESLSARTWEQIGDELGQRIVGSASFVAAVEARQQATGEHDEPLPVRQVMPKRQSVSALARVLSRQRAPWLAVAGLAVVFISSTIAQRSAAQFASLKQTIRTLASERHWLLRTRAGSPAVPAGDPAGTAGVTLASFAAPVHLNATEWQAEVRPVSGTHAAVRDRLVFAGGRMTSDTLRTEGFFSSRYSAVPQDDGTVAWETVQVDRSGVVVHWQGVSDGRTMHGMMTREAPGQAMAHHNFVGVAQPGAEGPDATTQEI